nr:Chain C, Globin c Chain [Glossoscolex paulistus]4U8U_G Chain G, Globin c Chain [Glossoscolex paulistus]4U8U_K Chain K, Globin c Chain [Glossoscolex paulistus]4U8U_R Chain R, Globin c Chain [Glossoscolex paulistus]4U8U_V Chain V, Globin c Chain [Glossoscolex paulistus]4U8U_Z Chain Z, Globin c Chain [Glossoscolex paulistus]4U8U_g Chain g, Globin c Chain [Glossoscolex paulistus]4U8U_k Chain k, Globin c Chain [Glossoscolex paulistus]4U8U_o Chain o, Globin c Chain [Glossoscolex paulistus]
HQFCCSAEDRNIVQKQWSVLWGDTESSKVKIAFGRLILTKLAKEIPEVKELFNKVDIDNPEGGPFSAHCLRILNALDMSINLMDDPEALDSALDHLADQHHDRPGVKKAHFKKIAEILHTGLQQVLDDYNALSWKSCFKGILGKIASKLQG